MQEAASSPVDRLAEALLIRPGEGRRTSLCFLHLFTASSVFVLGRTVRDTLFLSRYPLDALPWMFVLYGVASAITVVIYSRLSDRLSRSRSILGWSIVGIVLYVGTWLAVRAEQPWIYPSFYVASEVFANLAISQFWTLAGDLHDPRSARRLFGTIGAARVLGVIVVGLLAGAVVRSLGTEQLLFVLAGLQLVIMAVTRALAADLPAAKAAGPKTARPPPPVLSDRYVIALSAMLLFAFAALTIGDYQFKAIARATYQEDELAQFFSRFYAVTGIVSFLFQLAITPRLLSRFGVGAGMSVMPAVFGGASVVLLALPELVVATVMKFADNGFQYTIHDTTMQALYVPFAAAVKARTRTLLDAVVKPLAYGLGGLLLVLLAHLGPTALGWASVALVVGWAAAIPLVRTRYREKLESTLQSGLDQHLDAETAIDAIGRRVLLDGLASSEPRRVLAALEESEGLPSAEIAPVVLRLTSHASAAVRAAALERLAKLAGEVAIDRTAVRAALDAPEPDVRAAAARALAALGKDAEADTLGQKLDDPDRVVRTEVLASLLRHGAFEGAMVGGAHLTRLIASADPDDRTDAAHVLGALGSAGAKRLHGLLNDPEAKVRVAAVKAAAEVARAELVPDLTAALEDPHTEGAAGWALSRIGEPAIDAVSAVLADARRARRVRLAMPRVLGRIPSEKSWLALRAAEGTPDRQLRLRVLSALGRLRIALGRPPEPLERIKAAIEREIAEAEARRDGWVLARATLGTPLLDEAMAFSLVRARRRVLALLALRTAPEPLRRVREGLDDAARRANALEVLDSGLPASLRPIVMPFFDAEPDGKRASLAPPTSLEVLASELCRDPNPYVAMLTLERLTEIRHPLAVAEAQAAAEHVDPLVREAVTRALVTLAPADVAEPLLRRLATDPDPTVARHATRALACLPASRGETLMISTVEKLLSLRTAPVFAKVRSEDLAPLARVAEVEDHPKGSTLFTEGEPGDALYVVVRGEVEVRHAAEVLAHLSSGEAFGEMAVLDAGPRSATAVAATDVQVLRIQSAAFYEVLHEQPAIAEGVIRTLSQRLREANEALETARKS